MKRGNFYSKFKSVISESKDVLLALSISAGVIFSAYMFLKNQSHQAELYRIQSENEIVQKQANNFVAMALSETFISKLDSIIQIKVSMQLDTLIDLQEEIFEQASEFYMLSATRYDTLRIEQDYQHQQHVKLQLQISTIKRHLIAIQGDTGYLKDSSYTDSLQNELDRLKFEKQAQRILKDMEYYHKQTIEQIKKKGLTKKGVKVKRISKKPFQTQQRLFNAPL